MIFALFVVFACLASAFAANVRMEAGVNQFASANWIRDKLVTGDEQVQAVFVLKHNQMAMKAFERNLLDISNPKSARYGQWLSQSEVIEKISPSSENVKIVTDFLASQGVDSSMISVSKMQDKIKVIMPAKLANTVLQTEFAQFRSLLRRDIAITRITKPYYLPENVAGVVSLVDDILRFPSVRHPIRIFGAEQQTKDDDEFSSCGRSCNGYTTPAVLKARYNIPAVTSVASGNSMSVAEFQYQYYDATDLKSFGDACGVTATVDATIGGNKEAICEAGGCVEALLDIEYIEAVANPIPLTVFYQGSYSLIDWVDSIISMSNPPLVHSVSYGNDEVQQTSAEYMQSVNEQFMVAGSMGLSILFASGDQGVWGRSGVGSTYHPDFPAASPYVTSVGGTDFAVKSAIGDETAWSCGGGGFSDTFSAPSYQIDAVQSYLSSAAAAGVLPDSGLFNSTGRGYPDVAALGGQVNPYCVAYKGGSFGGVAGTSASCPVVAGIFAQLNNVRLAAGKPPLGFLNPLIYANPSCFNDVSDGSQNNCNRGTTGFSAISGWDAATGFGSPNYECLAKVV